METMQPYTTPRCSLLREKEQLISHSCSSLLAADYLDRTQSARDNLLFSQHCMVIPYTAMRVFPRLGFTPHGKAVLRGICKTGPPVRDAGYRLVKL